MAADQVRVQCQRHGWDWSIKPHSSLPHAPTPPSQNQPVKPPAATAEDVKTKPSPHTAEEREEAYQAWVARKRQQEKAKQQEDELRSQMTAAALASLEMRQKNSETAMQQWLENKKRMKKVCGAGKSCSRQHQQSSLGGRAGRRGGDAAAVEGGESPVAGATREHPGQ